MILKTALFFLAVAPFESLVILIWLPIPFIGIVLSIIAAILIALPIEGKRKDEFPDLNRFIFFLSAYIPGLIASLILCLICLNMPRSTKDIGGYGALVFGVIGFLAFLSQLLLTIIEMIVALRAPKPEWQIPPDLNIA